MLHGHINAPQTYQPFLIGPAWQKAINWLKNNQEKPVGEYEIQGRDIWASVATVATQPRSECVFEAHRQYIDIHFCIKGGEIIEWSPLEHLKPTMEFDQIKDYCLYEPPARATNLAMTPGMLAIFFPADAHMPKVQTEQTDIITKVVIKIKQSLV